jgi:hypothetical protein
VTAVLLAASPMALAEGELLTRDGYVKELEGMCKPRAKATQKAMKGVRTDIRYEDRLPIAVRKFDKAAEIFGGTIEQIAEVPRPAADVARLEEWFEYLNRQEQFLLEITDQLRVSHTIKAQRLTGRFITNGKKANNVTLAFGFDYCSFKFSRYGF